MFSTLLPHKIYIDVNDIPSIYELGQWIFSAEAKMFRLIKKKLFLGNSMQGIVPLNWILGQKKVAIKDFVVMVREAGI